MACDREGWRRVHASSGDQTSRLRAASRAGIATLSLLLLEKSRMPDLVSQFHRDKLLEKEHRQLHRGYLMVKVRLALPPQPTDQSHTWPIN